MNFTYFALNMDLAIWVFSWQPGSCRFSLEGGFSGLPLFLFYSLSLAVHTRARSVAPQTVVSIDARERERERRGGGGGRRLDEREWRRGGMKWKREREREREESMGRWYAAVLFFTPRSQGSLYTKVKNQSALFPLYYTRALAPPFSLLALPWHNPLKHTSSKLSADSNRPSFSRPAHPSSHPFLRDDTQLNVTWVDVERHLCFVVVLHTATAFVIQSCI